MEHEKKGGARKESTLDDKLRKIRGAFVEQLPTQLAKIREAFDVVVAKPDGREGRENLHRLLHTLRGGSASFGLGALGKVAAEAELLARRALSAETACDQKWQRGLQEQLQRLQREVEQLELAAATDFPTPEKVAPLRRDKVQRERKLVHICEDDEHLATTMATQLRCFGFEVAVFGELESMRQASLAELPDAVIMDIIFPDRPLGGTELMEELQAARPKVPTIFVSARDDLTARLAAVRAGADSYFVKPVEMTELCAMLTTLTQVEKPEPYQILIIDDDPQLAAYHAEILEDAGMETRVVTDPMTTITALTEFKPDLILMDMYMPGCNGMELAKVIRQSSNFFGIPIVYLSTEIDSDKQLHAICMGGDEFLTKPIKPWHLISSVAVRAERMKIVRSRMVHDAMTGLYNHTAGKEHLNLATSTAQRNGSPLCLAIIDVDWFKKVNDTYGHATGDQVLITLARLLKQRLRTTDIVCRFGGEEFGAILPGCDLPTAQRIMDEMRQSYAAIEFRADEVTFHSSFSCGVASIADCDGPVELWKAADMSLYAAKNGGRNRVVTWTGEQAINQGEEQ